MKKALLALILLLSASNAYALSDLAFGQWAGVGELELNGEKVEVQSNFLIQADPDGVEEKFFSWGLVTTELGILTHAFWACFHDTNKFDIVNPIDASKELGKGYLVVCPIIGKTEEDKSFIPEKIGYGSCIEMPTIGLLCDYIMEEGDYKVQETFIMKGGKLKREGLFTKGETKVSWEATLSPIKKNK